MLRSADTEYLEELITGIYAIGSCSLIECHKEGISGLTLWIPLERSPQTLAASL